VAAVAHPAGGGRRCIQALEFVIDFSLLVNRIPLTKAEMY